MNTVIIEYGVDASIDETSLSSNVDKLLQEHGKTNASVVVVISTEKVLRSLAIQYMKETPEEAKNHPVLSFPTQEIEYNFSYPPDMDYLGEVLVSIDWVENNAKNKSKQDLVEEMALHGTLHLLGIHHD